MAWLDAALASLVWIAALTLLHTMGRWFAVIKQRRKHWWLSCV